MLPSSILFCFVLHGNFRKEFWIEKDTLLISNQIILSSICLKHCFISQPYFSSFLFIKILRLQRGVFVPHLKILNCLLYLLLDNPCHCYLSSMDKQLSVHCSSDHRTNVFKCLIFGRYKYCVGSLYFKSALSILVQ